MLTRMSISGGILIFLILVLRFFTVQKLPKRLFVLLWDIALLRLLFPVSIPVRLPASHVTTAIRNAENSVLVLHGNEIPIAEASSGHFKIQNILFLLWLLGTAVWSVVFAYRYWKECGKIKEALPLSPKEENELRTLARIPGWVSLKKSDQILTPVSFGFIHPRILLSSVIPVTDRTQLKYVLTHELAHVKRMDYLRKLMMAAAVCLHWWNPAVWVMQYLYSRDLELSCDEKVVSYYGEESKEEYALTLVALAQMKSSAYWFSCGFGKHAVKERIEAIMKFKKMTVLTLAVAVLLAGTAITVFAKSATTENLNKENMESMVITPTEEVEKADSPELSDAAFVASLKEAVSNNKGARFSPKKAVSENEGSWGSVKYESIDDGQIPRTYLVTYNFKGKTGTYSGKAIYGLIDMDSGITFSMYTEDEKDSVYLRLDGDTITEITKEEYKKLVKENQKQEKEADE